MKTTILDAKLVVEEGDPARPLMSISWPVWAVAPGYLPEQIGYVSAELDKAGVLCFGILPEGAKRWRRVDLQTAVDHLRSTLPARPMRRLPQSVIDAMK